MINKEKLKSYTILGAIRGLKWKRANKSFYYTIVINIECKLNNNVTTIL